MFPSGRFDNGNEFLRKSTDSSEMTNTCKQLSYVGICGSSVPPLCLFQEICVSHCAPAAHRSTGVSQCSPRTSSGPEHMGTQAANATSDSTAAARLVQDSQERIHTYVCVCVCVCVCTYTCIHVCIALHALHYITWHYIALHCIALHCVRFHVISFT